MRHKVLVIKLGYSETLAGEVGTKCSLGDVLRTTSILHLFREDHVTWLTDPAAVPLLRGNPLIARILVVDLLTVLQLLGESFDVVVNLEKVPGICALADRVKAWHRLGFRLEERTGQAEAYDRSHEALSLATREDLKRRNDRNFHEIVFEMLGGVWRGEGYVLGYRPGTTVIHDVGLNSEVGPKWPVKAWPPESWNALERLLGEHRLRTSRQQGHDNLIAYMDWLHSCRTIVTNDSLGLHLGIAMGKNVVGLLGPTSESEIPPAPGLKILKPPLDWDCIPCFQPTCRRGDPCIAHIRPEAVAEAVAELAGTRARAP